jgi:hypothetical protein
MQGYQTCGDACVCSAQDTCLKRLFLQGLTKSLTYAGWSAAAPVCLAAAGAVGTGAMLQLFVVVDGACCTAYDSCMGTQD